jgi:hypothetical protein
MTTRAALALSMDRKLKPSSRAQRYIATHNALRQEVAASDRATRKSIVTRIFQRIRARG